MNTLNSCCFGEYQYAWLEMQSWSWSWNAVFLGDLRVAISRRYHSKSTQLGGINWVGYLVRSKFKMHLLSLVLARGFAKPHPGVIATQRIKTTTMLRSLGRDHCEGNKSLP